MDGVERIGLRAAAVCGLPALCDIAVGVVVIIDSRMAVDGDSFSSENTLGATVFLVYFIIDLIPISFCGKSSVMVIIQFCTCSKIFLPRLFLFTQ